MNFALTMLYNLADERDIDIICLKTRKVQSMSALIGNGLCGIGINPFMLNSEADETVKLAHELGHCETGSFYNKYAACDIRAKHERRADKWAIKKLIPKDELETACRFCANRFELAEYFGVTEKFIQKAIDYYSMM